MTFGVCVNPEQPDAYVEGLRRVIAGYDRYARNVEEAKRALNWENEKDALIDLYGRSRSATLQKYVSITSA